MATSGQTLTGLSNLMKVNYEEPMQRAVYTNSPFWDAIQKGGLDDPWIREVGGDGDYFYVPVETTITDKMEALLEDEYMAAPRKSNAVRMRFNMKYGHIPVEFTKQAADQTRNPKSMVGGGIQEFEMQAAKRAIIHDLRRQAMGGGTGAIGYIDTAQSAAGSQTAFSCEPGLYYWTKPFTVTNLVVNVLDVSALSGAAAMTTSEICVANDRAFATVEADSDFTIASSTLDVTLAAGDVVVRSRAAAGTAKAITATQGHSIKGWGSDLLGVAALMGWDKLSSNVPGDPCFEYYMGGTLTRAANTLLLPGYTNNAGTGTTNAPITESSLDTALLAMSDQGTNMEDVMAWSSNEVVIKLARLLRESMGVAPTIKETAGGWRAPTYETAFCGPVPFYGDPYHRHYRMSLIPMSMMRLTVKSPLAWHDWNNDGNVLRGYQDSTGKKFNLEAAMYYAMALWCSAPWQAHSIGCIAE